MIIQPPFRVIQRPLSHRDLPEINRVIQASIESWPTTARLKRLSMSPLRYRDADLQDFEFVLCYKAHACLGIAAWQPDVPLVFQRSESFAKGEQSQKVVNAVLLHGLFVSAEAQGRGIGGLLLDELTRQAMERRFAGIFAKAERFSISFFEQKGFHPLRDGDQVGLQPANYPHRYLMDLSV
jgi:GNAT superfamily N-acetyltransferase